MPEAPKQSGDGRVYTGGGRRSIAEGGRVQCGAMRTTSNRGNRCNKDALADTDPPRCEQHYLEYEGKGELHQHRFYSRRLRPELAAAVAANLEGLTVVDQLNVSEELVLIREAAGDMVEEYSKACAPEVTSETRAEIGAMMTERLEKVLHAVETMSKVERVKLEVSGVLAGAMSAVIAAVVDAANEVFQNDYRLPEFCEALQSRLEKYSHRTAALGDGSDGTTLTPDQDVLAMDDLVPRAPG